MMNKDMLLHQHHQPQQVQHQQDENMSNLTSASGDQASVSSGNITEASGSNYFPHHQQQQQEQEQQQQLYVPDSQPQKKRRNQPGNPGLSEKKNNITNFLLGFGLIHYSNYLILSSSLKLWVFSQKEYSFYPFCSLYHLYSKLRKNKTKTNFEISDFF